MASQRDLQRRARIEQHFHHRPAGAFRQENATTPALPKPSRPFLCRLGLASVSIVSGVTALIGAPIFALGIATVCGLPLLYKGTQLLFRKEIAQMQATQHLKEGQDK